MTDKEQQYLQKLQQNRRHIVDTLKDPAAKGVWESIIGKYSGKAHFLYEVLQNADDVNATWARFELYEDKLVFRHNGTRLFTISDPDTEGEDTAQNSLGDINSITSIGNSSKTDDGNKIGKFGMGFKAVFQYTMAPYIYDPDIAFKIEDYMVPILLDDDYPGRNEEETVFVFPFDREDITPKEAVEDISEKLESLVMPILFLHSLKEISYDCFESEGIFRKEILETKEFGETIATKILLTGPVTESQDMLWLFTRKDNELDYSVGFFLNADGKLLPKSPYAFCYFPTLVTTNLNFLIQAPFLLTDSREGIKEKEKHNVRIVQLLANLAADSFLYLRDIGGAGENRLVDDNIMDIIPYKRELFEQTGRISFMPFYDSIRKTFAEERVIPGRNCFVTREEAYWADTETIANLLSDEQLSLLVGKAAHWIFPTKGRNTYHRGDLAFCSYIDTMCDKKNVTEDKLLYSYIDEEFIEAQTDKWLDIFYKYLLTRGLKTKIREIPIFLDEKRKATCAYDINGNATLFLPDDDQTGFVTINRELYQYESTQKLLKELEIKTPDLESKVYSKVIPQYENDSTNSVRNDKANFKTFLKYYIHCLTYEAPNGEYYDGEYEANGFIKDIKNFRFISCASIDYSERGVESASKLYLPTEELVTFFAGFKDVLFVDKETYIGYLSKHDLAYLDKFLLALGVSKIPKLKANILRESDVYEEYGYKWDKAARNKEDIWEDYCLEGCENYILAFKQKPTLEGSLLLWNTIVTVRLSDGRNTWKGGVRHYFYRGSRQQTFEGSEIRRLRKEPWIMTKKGEFKAPKDITIQELAKEYDVSGNEGKALLQFLQIKDNHPEYDKLPEEERWKFEVVDMLTAEGFSSIEDIREFLTSWREEKNKESYHTMESEPSDQSGKLSQEKNNPELGQETAQLSREEQLALSLGRQAASRKKKEEKLSTLELSTDENLEPDQDEYSKAPINYSDRINETKKKCEDEIAKITVLEDAQKRAEEAPKYSYGWFKALLDLESIDNGTENVRSREISVTFSKVRREPGTRKTLVLEHPDAPLDAAIDKLVDFTITLKFFDGRKKNLIVEVANIQSYDLRVKLKSAEGLDAIDFDEVKEIGIDTKSPTFLLNELQKQFVELQINGEGGVSFHPEDDFDMKSHLCENIEFIFGPPGTGKTTYLANEVIIPLVAEKETVKILLMTPTNKAADVLVRRIMEVMGEDHSYENWLIRYGITEDEYIEKSPVFRDREIDLSELKQVVIVTTIVRYPYDYFIAKNKENIYINGIDWDYIIVDEASMIPLVNLIYPLYAQTPKKFIIAGDPFQIEPTTAVALWKDENIYTLVGLNTFMDIHTEPHDYPVKLLKKQYRSIASIGEVFSNLTYGGVIEHAREDFERRELNIEDCLEYDSLNLITFPTSKYESIYKTKRLKNSSYQPYSALFAYEFVCYLARNLAEKNPGEKFQIGLIAPYNAQASLIEKLIDAAKLPDTIDVHCGTIHRFQGDECDVIIALFNPPPKITRNDQMFLNKQNIINVAISRAKDYLFVLMPNDETENVNCLTLLNTLKSLIRNSGTYMECSSNDIEKVMFGDETYLEKNAFSTGHQFVNVYGVPEKHYEIRSEDSAVDIQVHEEKGEKSI